MIFAETRLNGAYVIDVEKKEDNRGFFARTFCKREFGEYGLKTDYAQCNLSLTKKAGCIRGMHYQTSPNEEVKLVRCIKGAIYDVIIDLRHDSLTYGEWIGVELTSYNYRMLYVPEGFAHGFQSLTDDTEVYYFVSQFYAPESERGLRYNDPVFNIEWPMDVTVISDKDRNWPDYKK